MVPMFPRVAPVAGGWAGPGARPIHRQPVGGIGPSPARGGRDTAHATVARVGHDNQKPRSSPVSGAGAARNTGHGPVSRSLAKAQPGWSQAGLLASGSSFRRAFPSRPRVETVACCGGRRRLQRRVRGRFSRPSLLARLWRAPATRRTVARDVLAVKRSELNHREFAGKWDSKSRAGQALRSGRKDRGIS